MKFKQLLDWLTTHPSTKKLSNYPNCYGGGILFTNIVLYGQGKLPAKEK